MTPPGRDRRRVLHPAPAGRPSAETCETRPHAVVVGAGIAGLAAAAGLAERGITVEVIERERYIGGRVGGWCTQLADGSSFAVNRGFHAFFRQYYNLRALLGRGDPDSSGLTPIEDYPLIDAHGRRDSFRGLPRTPPWNALFFALRSPTFRFRDILALDPRAAAPLAAPSFPDVYDQLDHLDAETFLDRLNFPPAARHLAFDVFSRSFFVKPDRMSAAELVAMFHIYFLGSSEGLIFDVANTNFDEFWAPLYEYLTASQVRFHLGEEITAIRTEGPTPFRVYGSTGAHFDADGVVLATDVAGLQRIIAASPTLGSTDWRSDVAALGTAPPFAVHRLWLDRRVAADRPAFLGTGGLEPLDNISVLERYEQQAAAWSRRNGGSVIELHAYALPDHAATESAQASGVREGMLARLHAIYPETATAGIVAEDIQLRCDCPRFSPGDFARRPGVATPHPNLALAGDGIRIDLPVALMERAATTGWSAANDLLAQWGIAGHPLHTVPMHGRSALLRRIANRGKQATR